MPTSPLIPGGHLDDKIGGLLRLQIGYQNNQWLTYQRQTACVATVIVLELAEWQQNALDKNDLGTDK